MVTIRLSRGGAKKRPFYHIVVADSRCPRDGRNIERLGLYNPIATGSEEFIRIQNDRLEYWLSKGAQVSQRVQKVIELQAAALKTDPTAKPARPVKVKKAKKAAPVEAESNP